MEIPEKGPLHSLPVREGSKEDRPPLPAEPYRERTTTEQRDSISLTQSGRDYKTAVNQVQLLPENRDERVLQLKRQLENGTYHVEGDRIAVNMIDEAVENNIVLKHIDTKV